VMDFSSKQTVLYQAGKKKCKQEHRSPKSNAEG
jgi:hypothetical protein